MKHAVTNIVPKLLNFEKKQQETLTTFNDNPDLIKKFITSDDGYDFKSKADSSQWKRPKEPKPKKAHQVRSHVFTAFFNCNGMVHHEFLPQDRPHNKEYYLKVMSRLLEAIHQKCTEL